MHEPGWWSICGIGLRAMPAADMHVHVNKEVLSTCSNVSKSLLSLDSQCGLSASVVSSGPADHLANCQQLPSWLPSLCGSLGPAKANGPLPWAILPFIDVFADISDHHGYRAIISNACKPLEPSSWPSAHTRACSRNLPLTVRTLYEHE